MKGRKEEGEKTPNLMTIQITQLQVKAMHLAQKVDLNGKSGYGESRREGRAGIGWLANTQTCMQDTQLLGEREQTISSRDDFFADVFALFHHSF